MMKSATKQTIKITFIITILAAICLIIALVWANNIHSSAKLPADIKTSAAARTVPAAPAEMEPPEDANTDADPALAKAPPISPVNAKKSKALNAQIQAVEAQLRFWKNEEKSKVKIGEVTQLSQLIRQNVKALWLEKLELEEAAKNLNINVAQKISKGKWQGKKQRSEPFDKLRTGFVDGKEIKKPGDTP